MKVINNFAYKSVSNQATFRSRNGGETGLYYNPFLGRTFERSKNEMRNINILWLTMMGVVLVGGVAGMIICNNKAKEKKMEFDKATQKHLVEIYTNSNSKNTLQLTSEQISQMHDILSDKNTLLEKLPSNKRMYMEQYHSQLLDVFSSPESEQGATITPKEQEMIKKLMTTQINYQGSL